MQIPGIVHGLMQLMTDYQIFFCQNQPKECKQLSPNVLKVILHITMKAFKQCKGSIIEIRKQISNSSDQFKLIFKNYIYIYIKFFPSLV